MVSPRLLDLSLKTMFKIIKANIPNTITCLNLLAGCLACIFAFHSQESFGTFKGYEIVYMLIGASALFDFCDGAAARLLHAYSNLGKELDSLADLISFGVAPAMLIFNTMSYYNNGEITSYLALTIAICGALRLARFNIDERQTETFIGLPIPANAIFWIGTCAWINNYTYPGDIAIIIILFAMSYMMVAPLRMFSLKFKNFYWRANIKRYGIILTCISFVIFYGIPGLAWTIILYILLSAFSRKNSK